MTGILVSPRERRVVWAFTSIGLVLAATAWVMMVVLASTGIGSSGIGSYTVQFLGVEFVTATRSIESAGSTSVSLEAHLGCLLVLLLPLAGFLLGRRRASRIAQANVVASGAGDQSH